MIPTTINYAVGLVDGQRAGAYTLPEPITQTVLAYHRAAELSAEPAAGYARADAAQAAYAALTTSGSVDLTRLAKDVRAGVTERSDLEEAAAIAIATLELAASHAITTATEHGDAIITDHLRPAYDSLLADVRQSAKDLDGISLDLHGLLNAPAKTRKAYEHLAELVMRREALWHARKMVIRLTGQRAQHDEEGLFTEFRDRLALHPGLQPTQRVPELRAPNDPKERLLWLVGEAAVATPWMPTVAEADARWWDTFGKRIEDRAARQGQARATFGVA